MNDGAIPAQWHPLTNENGEPVTITWQQVYAIWHAIDVVEEVRFVEGRPSLWEGNPSANLAKSQLLGRLLVEGKPPLPQPSP